MRFDDEAISFWFVGKMPADAKVTRLSRTAGKDRLVDEFIMSFTHDVELDFRGPGMCPAVRPA